MRDTTLHDENASQHVQSVLVTALCNQPEAFTLDLCDCQSCYLLDCTEPSGDKAAIAIENIADAVTHARFVGTDPGSDEVVLMKILHVRIFTH